MASLCLKYPDQVGSPGPCGAVQSPGSSRAPVMPFIYIAEDTGGSVGCYPCILGLLALRVT